MSKEQKLVPKMRFKEFEDSQPWQNKDLGDMVNFYSGLTYSPGNIVEEPGTLVIRSSNVKNGEIVSADNVYVDSAIANSENVQIGDIIVVVRNGSRHLIGKNAQVKIPMENTVIGAFMTGIRSNTSKFINALLDTKNFQIEIYKDLGATINQITTGNLRKMKFNFPNEDEANRIGIYFEKIDNLIISQRKKINKVKDIKSAYLSEMFPKEGEKYPKRRFEGFTEPWKTIKMREVFSTVLSGNRLPKTSLKGGNIPYILATTENNGVYARIDKETRDYHGNKMKIFNTPSISFSIDNPEAIFLQEENYFTSNIMRVLINNDLEKEEYIFFVETLRKATGGFNWGVKFSGPVVLDLDINVPFNKMEDKIDNQEIKKIGLFINELDEAEKLEKSKLEKLEKLKQAYLNDMFV